MKTFDIITAQPVVWSALSRSFESGRLATTYLLTGPEGSGHFPLAIAFASLLNCEKPATDGSNDKVLRPCGQCYPCRAIAGLNFEGLFPILPIPTHKSENEAIDLTNEQLEQLRANQLAIPYYKTPISIPIAMARKIKKQLSTRGSDKLTRVVLFDRMEKMRASSADALLKLIEEPPLNCCIIMTAPRPESLLATIRSRSRLIRLNRVDEGLIMNYLVDNCGLSENRATLVARLSQGMPGIAVRMAGREEDEESLRPIAWLIFKTLFTQSKAEAVFLVTDLLNPRDRSAAEELLKTWQSFIRDMNDFAVSGSDDNIVNVDFVSDIKKLSGFFGSAATAEALIGSIQNTLADFRLNVHIQAALVALVLKIGSVIDEVRQGAPISPY
ncbi:MAG: hypothetical protein V3T31_03225 [candidate division Zixibacteria bacterium]